MNSPQRAGFEELPHTADWALRVWAPDLAGLFAESARGMNALSGARPVAGPRLERTFNAEAPDPEDLLVRFLSELVCAVELERLVFDRFEIAVREGRLQVAMSGAPLEALTKAIKAVTYHNLHIRRTARGYEVEIVFDV
jgi:SHS2 domain-containing protein